MNGGDSPKVHQLRRVLDEGGSRRKKLSQARDDRGVAFASVGVMMSDSVASRFSLPHLSADTNIFGDEHFERKLRISPVEFPTTRLDLMTFYPTYRPLPKRDLIAPLVIALLDE